LEIRSDGISYVTPFGNAKFIAFSEISTVVIIDYQHLGSQAQSTRTPFTWTLIITPNPEAGKPALRIPLTFFPQVAYEEITKLLKPEVWESPTWS
jgi:hypothetical protein